MEEQFSARSYQEEEVPQSKFATLLRYIVADWSCPLMESISAVVQVKVITRVLFAYGLLTFILLGMLGVLASIDIVFRTQNLESAIHFISEVHGYALPTLKILHAMFAIFLGFPLVSDCFSHNRYGMVVRNKKRMDTALHIYNACYALKVKLKDGGECCCICLCSIERCHVVRIVMDCQHCFHASCLELWLMHANTCPLCRAQVCFTISTISS